VFRLFTDYQISLPVLALLYQAGYPFSDIRVPRGRTISFLQAIRLGFQVACDRLDIASIEDVHRGIEFAAKAKRPSSSIITVALTI
jgi:hypothetical protein